MKTKQFSAVGGVSGKISITYDDQKYKVVELTLSETEKLDAEGKPSDSGIKISRLMAYFSVLDPTSGDEINNFSLPLIFHIKYSAADWEQALKNDKAKKFDRPRIAYLVRKNKNKKWADRWVEFKKKRIINAIKPGTGGDPNGYLVLYIKKLKDPLIGGC